MSQVSPVSPESTAKGTAKRTPLYSNHVRRGARMVDFAGWDMPLQYTKVLEEHEAVRQRAGLFDISHMGLVVVTTGEVEKTREFLNKLVPQDLSKLYPGKAVYTQFLNQQGGILDDIIIYMLPEELPLPGFREFLVICNAANTKLDCQWMRQHAPEGAEIKLVSGDYALLALQGPRFAEVLSAQGIQPDSLPGRFHVNAAHLSASPVLVARTGYTGEDGVELIVPSAAVSQVWDGLLEAGQAVGLQPIGLAARDTLRLEAAYPLHGHDISANDSPLEAGLGWSVKLEKPVEYVGQAALKRQKEQGLARKFYCFKLKKKTIPRQDDLLLWNGQPVGKVTSGSISPTLNEPIGMGYIKSGIVSGPGDVIQVRIRGAEVDAEIVERPFYKAR